MRLFFSSVVLALALAACGTTYQVPLDGGPSPVSQAPSRAGSGRTAADFARVARRVEPVAESVCLEETPGAGSRSCNFRLRLETDPRMPPNAFQTRTDDGRPLIVMSASLLGQMQSNDEIAFVLSHEAAHHIADHIPKQAQQQALGALVLGGIIAAAGDGAGGAASDASIRQAMDLGAAFGARAYSQTYELEADTLGTFIAMRAGYDPERGTLIFTRPALASGGGLLSTHPASPQRLATVQRASAEARRQQAAGVTPRPDYAGRRF